MTKSPKRVITIIVIVLAALAVLGIFFWFFPFKHGDYRTHRAFTVTTRVDGLITYNVRSDYIIEIPEEDFKGLIVGGKITYEELIKKFGEPSGMFGSGIVRYYWRIGEDKYAVLNLMGGGFSIVNGEGSYDKKVWK